MIKAIGFDADDTLWHNESIFDRAQQRYRALLAKYHPAAEVDRALFATEMRNLPLYGYGVRSFTLSAVETAIDLTKGAISAQEIQEIMHVCREMLAHPVELLPGVVAAVTQLAADYRLIVITKGDLHHQERKVAESGLAAQFHAVEIVSEKDDATYVRVLRRHGVAPAEFAMVGNSVKSDILPVLRLGGAGVQIPYHLTWAHEHTDESPAAHPRFRQLESIDGLAAVVAAL
ncbi:MAG: HAD family hydrolase [Opitutae bacterium]|nr:HAD family hydrolase [Opitutae bacterium]